MLHKITTEWDFKFSQALFKNKYNTHTYKHTEEIIQIKLPPDSGHRTLNKPTQQNTNRIINCTF